MDKDVEDAIKLLTDRGLLVRYVFTTGALQEIVEKCKDIDGYSFPYKVLVL